MRELKKSTNSVETRRIKKILNEEARLGISPNSDSEAEEVDLIKELYPLGHYINNREEMIEQMFSIIKGAKLKKMLPPILKDMPVDELKADCLIHLLGMSKKRIRAILEGKEINSSSDSECQTDDSSSPSKKPKLDLKPFVIKQEGCSDISDNSEEVVLVDPDLDLMKARNIPSAKSNTTESRKKSKRKLKIKELDRKHKRTRMKVKEETYESDEVLHIDSSSESASGNEMETKAPQEGKTLLEILELEMRARAIRALLKSNEPQEDEVSPTAVENSIQDSENAKEKSRRHIEEDTTKKVVPPKSFRKKKQKSVGKNDDVIVITPKVVTIDLTDETELGGVKTSSKGSRYDSVPSSSQNNSSDHQSGEVLDSDSPKINNEDDRSSMAQRENITVVEEQVSKAKLTNIFDKEASCSVEKSSKSQSSENAAEPNNDKSSWAQRWLESKEVKKVVSTSKICGSIRKKIKSARLAQKQKPVEIKPEIPSPTPQKEIEGSVGEYELLPKSKSVTGSDVDGAIDNDTQSSVLSANQEPSSSETGLNQTLTADQVQDVSSTRVECLSNDLVQFETDTNDVTTKAKFNEETDVLVSANEEEKMSHVTGVNKIYDGNPNDSVGDSIEVNLTSNNAGKDCVVSKSIEDENLKCQENFLDLEVLKAKSNTDGLCAVICEQSISTDCESPLLDNDETVNDLSIRNRDSNNEHDPKLHKEITISEISETLNNIVSVCNAKAFLEPNEPETLEINITDEDRDIEDVVEDISNQNQTKSCKESVIVID